MSDETPDVPAVLEEGEHVIGADVVEAVVEPEPEPAAVSEANLTDEVGFELTSEPAVAVPVVVDTEHGWTAQSSHGVLLPMFVPTDDYQALDTPAHQIEGEGNDW